MTHDEANTIARELVESRLQRMELERLAMLNTLRELEAQINIRRARLEADVTVTAQQLTSE